MSQIRPFLGRMLVEVIQEEGDEFIKKKMVAEGAASEDFLSKFDIVPGDMVVDEHSGERKFKRARGKPPISKGKIVSMAKDCFGQAFKDRFGNDREYPKEGDIVYFVPHKSYQTDLDNKYHIVDDCEIVGFVKAEEV